MTGGVSGELIIEPDELFGQNLRRTRFLPMRLVEFPSIVVAAMVGAFSALGWLFSQA